MSTDDLELYRSLKSKERPEGFSLDEVTRAKIARPLPSRDRAAAGAQVMSISAYTRTLHPIVLRYLRGRYIHSRKGKSLRRHPIRPIPWQIAPYPAWDPKAQDGAGCYVERIFRVDYSKVPLAGPTA